MEAQEKLHKNFHDPPTAMKNNKGHILTDKNDILEETVNHYEKVLKGKKDLNSIKMKENNWLS